MGRKPVCSLLVSCLLAAVAGLVAAPSARSAETIAVRYGAFEESLPVADLRRYAETGTVSTKLSDFLRVLSREQQQAARGLLLAQMPVDLVALDRVLNGVAGNQFLTQVAATTTAGEYPGVQALRAAAILGTRPTGLSVLSFLEAYPTQRLTILLPKMLKFIAATSPQPPTDRLSSLPFWQTWVEYQTTVGQKQPYQTCLFGDSISAQLGSALGNQLNNFAIGGMSSVSLVEQLQRLVAAKVTCQTAIVEIGTNDAWYSIADDRVEQNLRQAIGLIRQLKATKIALIPAFYSTLAASKNPRLAGPISRVEAINRILNQVAIAENVSLKTAEIQPLFEGQALKESLTTDGVHLNREGMAIYAQALITIIRSN